MIRLYDVTFIVTYQSTQATVICTEIHILGMIGAHFQKPIAKDSWYHTVMYVQLIIHGQICRLSPPPPPIIIIRLQQLCSVSIFSKKKNEKLKRSCFIKNPPLSFFRTKMPIFKRLWPVWFRCMIYKVFTHYWLLFCSIKLKFLIKKSLPLPLFLSNTVDSLSYARTQFRNTAITHSNEVIIVKSLTCTKLFIGSTRML